MREAEPEDERRRTNEPVDGDLHGSLLGGEVEHVDAAQRDGHLHVRQLLVPRLQCKGIILNAG